VALEKGEPAGALKMLDRAAAAFPDNPFIQLDRVGLLAALGRADEGIGALKTLRALPWSTVYYSEIPQRLRRMAEASTNPASRNAR